MWSLESRWFDAAVVLAIFAFGNVLFGRFEEHKNRGRRVLKVALVVTVIVGLAATAGRAWAYGVMSIPLLGALWVHAYWLPKHGISGWTAEPRDKYIELMRSRSRSK